LRGGGKKSKGTDGKATVETSPRGKIEEKASAREGPFLRCVIEGEKRQRALGVCLFLSTNETVFKDAEKAELRTLQVIKGDALGEEEGNQRYRGLSLYFPEGRTARTRSW